MNEEIVKQFWTLVSDGEFDKAGELMAEDAVVLLPNTREVFNGRSKYINFNKKYPGRWIINIEKIFSQDDIIISAAKVESEDKLNSLYLVAFLKLKNNKIHEITEYWGDNGEPPKWRIEECLSERY